MRLRGKMREIRRSSATCPVTTSASQWAGPGTGPVGVDEAEGPTMELGAWLPTGQAIEQG